MHLFELFRRLRTFYMQNILDESVRTLYSVQRQQVEVTVWAQGNVDDSARSTTATFTSGSQLFQPQSFTLQIPELLMPRDTSASPRRRPRAREDDRSGRREKNDYPRTDRAHGNGYERDLDRRRDKGDDDRRAGHDDYCRREDRRDRDRHSKRPNRERDREGQDNHDRPSRPNRERDREGQDDYDRPSRFNRGRDREGPDDHDRPSRRRSRDLAVSSRRSASPKRPSSIQPSARPRSSSRSKSPSSNDKAKPNFANSGLLAAETNAVKLTDGTSTILKYNEPPEARKPTLGWRLYVFKGSEQVGRCHIFLF